MICVGSIILRMESVLVEIIGESNDLPWCYDQFMRDFLVDLYVQDIFVNGNCKK